MLHKDATEYRALTWVLRIIAGYLAVVLSIGFITFCIYFSANDTARAEATAQGASPVWFGFSLTMAGFTNAGMVLLRFVCLKTISRPLT